MKRVFKEKYEELVRRINKYFPDGGGYKILEKAFWFGYDSHNGQFRRSGAPYFEHCVEAANILAELQLDLKTIAACLLHDVVEDTGVSIEEVKEGFGEDIAMLVDGVTKITDLRFKDAEIKQAENFRKMLLSMARDIRVIMIKFADRLHNMRTLEHLPKRKQKWIARETLDVYAPLAHRFGIARLAWQLEDLALKFLDPDSYIFIDKMIEEKWSDKMEQIEKMKDPIRREMINLNIPCSIVARPKSYYSVYKKMTTENISPSEIHDLLALRIITDKKETCYAAVGVVHTLFIPVADRFTDYIATPKSNGYQSIHTTVIIPDGHMMEVHIRNKAMDLTAEMGIAAHWSYDTKYTEEDLDKQLDWFHQFIDMNIEDANPAEFMESFKFDLVQHEIFVFSPRGKLIKLPKDATPVDFAFDVHTEVGLHCIGAKVNSKVVPLNTTLQNGDEVQILTSSKPNPQESWLSFVITSKAISLIGKWLRDNRKKLYKEHGRKLLFIELSNNNIPEKELTDKLLKQRSGFSNLDALYTALVQHEVTPEEIAKRLFPSVYRKNKVSLFRRIPRIWKSESKEEPYLIIEGEMPKVIELSRCCRPIPGDKIFGYFDENKGVIVHRSRCKNIPGDSFNGKHNIKVDWAADLNNRVFATTIKVTGVDRKHLLRDIAIAISELDINVLVIHIEAKETVAICDITMEVKDLSQLDEVNRKISKIKGVQRVVR